MSVWQVFVFFALLAVAVRLCGVQGQRDERAEWEWRSTRIGSWWR